MQFLAIRSRVLRIRVPVGFKLIDRFRSTRYVKYVRDGTLATDIMSDVRYGGRHRAVYNI